MINNPEFKKIYQSVLLFKQAAEVLSDVDEKVLKKVERIFQFKDGIKISNFASEDSVNALQEFKATMESIEYHIQDFEEVGNKRIADASLEKAKPSTVTSVFSKKQEVTKRKSQELAASSEGEMTEEEPKTSAPKAKKQIEAIKKPKITEEKPKPKETEVIQIAESDSEEEDVYGMLEDAPQSSKVIETPKPRVEEKVKSVRLNIGGKNMASLIQMRNQQLPKMDKAQKKSAKKADKPEEVESLRFSGLGSGKGPTSPSSAIQDGWKEVVTTSPNDSNLKKTAQADLATLCEEFYRAVIGKAKPEERNVGTIFNNFQGSDKTREFKKDPKFKSFSAAFWTESFANLRKCVIDRDGIFSKISQEKQSINDVLQSINPNDFTIVQIVDMVNNVCRWKIDEKTHANMIQSAIEVRFDKIQVMKKTAEEAERKRIEEEKKKQEEEEKKRIAQEALKRLNQALEDFEMEYAQANFEVRATMLSNENLEEIIKSHNLGDSADKYCNDCKNIAIAIQASEHQQMETEKEDRKAADELYKFSAFLDVTEPEHDVVWKDYNSVLSALVKHNERSINHNAHKYFCELLDNFLVDEEYINTNIQEEKEMEDTQATQKDERLEEITQAIAEKSQEDSAPCVAEATPAEIPEKVVVEQLEETNTVPEEKENTEAENQVYLESTQPTEEPAEEATQVVSEKTETVAEPIQTVVSEEVSTKEVEENPKTEAQAQPMELETPKACEETQEKSEVTAEEPPKPVEEEKKEEPQEATIVAEESLKPVESEVPQTANPEAEENISNESLTSDQTKEEDIDRQSSSSAQNKRKHEEVEEENTEEKVEEEEVPEKTKRVKKSAPVVPETRRVTRSSEKSQNSKKAGTKTAKKSKK